MGVGSLPSNSKGMNNRTYIFRFWEQTLVAVLAVVVFCFWYFGYPFIPLVREMSQLFLWNCDYLTERLVVPGGAAQYLGEGVAQFFLNPFNGALAYAILFVIAQQLASRLLRQFFPSIKNIVRFLLSLVPPAILWYLAMLPHIPLTPTMAAILVMVVMCAVMSINKRGERREEREEKKVQSSKFKVQREERKRLIAVCLLIPVMYWLTGPMAVLLILCCVRWIPLTATLFAACLIGSSYLTSYPLRQVVRGIDYSWSGSRNMGTYEEMECDMLMRQQKWAEILQKFQKPESPAVRSASMYALHRTGQMSKQEFLSRVVVPEEIWGSEPSVFGIKGVQFVVYFGSLSSAFIVSDLASMLYWPNISQRAAFEAMEYIPNYNKSGRALKNLIEVCIITGQYPLARKYLSILDETTLYRSWAKKMRTLVDNPRLIEKNSFMQKSRESYENTEDIFFI